MALITGGQSSGGTTEVEGGSGDPVGAATGDLQLAVNNDTGGLFYRGDASLWTRYEEGVVVRATGNGIQDTANITAAAAASNKILIDDRDAPLTLDQGGQVLLGDTFLESRSGMSRINLHNNTAIQIGTYLNYAAHTGAGWETCTVSADKDAVTSATLAGAEAGDVLIVISEDLITTVLPQFALGSQRPCEHALIERVSGTTMYLSTPLVDTYTVTPRCALFKFNGGGGIGPLSTRGGIANIDFSGSTNTNYGGNTGGIFFYSTYRPIIENIIMQDCGHLSILGTLSPQVRGVYIDSQSNGWMDYGITLGFADDVVIDGLVSHRTRHAVTTTGQAAGTHRYGTIRRAKIRNSQAFTSGFDVSEFTTTFTGDAATDEIILVTNPLAPGNLVTLSTTGSLPGGLAATNYYIRGISGNRIKLSSSENGTIINITSAGTPTNTLTRASTSNIAFDTHAEGYEVTFEDCDVTLGGPSSVSPSTGGSMIGFSTRSRFTTYRRCRVFGDISAKHRGWTIDSCPGTRIEHCSMLGGWAGVHAEAANASAPRPDAVTVLGGTFENLRCEAVILDGGIGHIVDGIRAINVGAVAGGLFGASRACVSFWDRFGVGYGFSIVRNSQLQKSASNLYSVGISTLDATNLVLENNDTSYYDNCEIGLDRSLTGAASLELKYGRKQVGRLPYGIVQQAAHGLTTASLFAPITTAHVRYVDTSAAQEVHGILVDVIDTNTYCVIKPGQAVEMPDTMISGAYTIAGSGRSLWWDDSAVKWLPSVPPGAHGDARPMLYVDAYATATIYARVGQSSEWAI